MNGTMLTQIVSVTFLSHRCLLKVAKSWFLDNLQHGLDKFESKIRVCEHVCMKLWSHCRISLTTHSYTRHTAEILRKRAKKCARAQNVSFCHLWGILKLLWAKKMKSVENINRYEAFPFSPQEMTRKMPLEIIFSLKLKNHLL